MTRGADAWMTWMRSQILVPALCAAARGSTTPTTCAAYRHRWYAGNRTQDLGFRFALRSP